MDFWINEDCMKYAINRVKKKKYSKNGVLKFVKRDDKLYLIDGYHRLAEYFEFDVDFEIFEKEIINIKTKIYPENFIKFNEFKPS